MVPFHDSDVAENRWKEGEWRQFELWERIELRFRRKRFWTVAGVILLFLGLLSIPIIQDRAPKWRGENAMRKLAMRANQMKVDAAALGVPLRMRLEHSESGPLYVIEKVSSCDVSSEGTLLPDGARGQEWSRGPLFSGETGRDYTIVTPEGAERLGLERIVSSLCYEPHEKVSATGETPALPAPVRAIGVITVNDLSAARLDRIAFVNFSGLSAEIDFD